MEEWIAGVAADWATGRMAGGEIVAGIWIWMHWRYFAGVDWFGDWRMDLHGAGDCAREYVFAFVGGGHGGGGDFGVDCAFVLWGKATVGGTKFENREEKSKAEDAEFTENAEKTVESRKLRRPLRKASATSAKPGADLKIGQSTG